MKKTTKKILVLTSGAALLVSASVMGTMAYLTSKTEEVTNTFTVGSVAITLDELDVDGDDMLADNKKYETADGQTTVRDRANKYHLVPGHEYTKDPTVHVDSNSENSWIFVKVENEIEAIETASINGTIVTQIKANGWVELADNNGVYYREWTKDANTNNDDLVVFENFKISENVLGGSKPSGEADDTKLYINDYLNKYIKVTAYAVQRDTIVDTAIKAWNIVNQ